MEIHIYHVLELYGFLLHAKYARNPDFAMFCFPIRFSYYLNSLSPFFGNNTTVVKTIPIPLSIKHLCETFHWGGYPTLSPTQYLLVSALCHRSMEIYILQKSSQCHVQQCFCNISMNMKIGIRLEIDPSGHTQVVASEVFVKQLFAERLQSI